MLKFALLAALALFSSVAQADEQDISLKTPTGTLWGTLNQPASQSAAVLILPGSGPTDRNGNGPSIHPDLYKMFAHDLGEKGITSLRIDKRGIGESSTALSAETVVRFQLYVDDARAWASDLKSRTGVKCVWLVGHSEGALVAEVAAEDDADICGLVLVSGAGRRAGDLIRSQLDANPGMTPEMKAGASQTLAELEAGRIVASPPPELKAMFRVSVQPYLISWLALDPAAILAQIKKPVLILQGGNDIQISVDDAKLLAKAQPDAKLVIFPGVNHIMKVAPADRAGNFATYGDPTLPLAPDVAGTIVHFIATH